MKVLYEGIPSWSIDKLEHSLSLMESFEIHWPKEYTVEIRYDIEELKRWGTDPWLADAIADIADDPGVSDEFGVFVKYLSGYFS